MRPGRSRERWLPPPSSPAAVAPPPLWTPVNQANVMHRFQGWVKAWNLYNPDSLAPFYIQKDLPHGRLADGDRTLGWAPAESAVPTAFCPP